MSAYLWILCGGAVLAACVYCLMNRGDRGVYVRAALTLVLSVVFGLLCGKAFYAVTQIRKVISSGTSEVLFTLSPLWFSFYGAAMGACFGAVLAGKLTGIKPMAALNRFAPAGILMAAVARFGEYVLSEEYAYGLGRYFDIETQPALCVFPISAVNAYGEYYLAVFMLEGLCCLGVFVLSAFVFHRARFMRSLFYFCLPQILCESLRTSSFVWHEFVKVEQLLCMVVMEIILLLYALRTPKDRKLRFLPPILGLVAAGIFVAVEFALDKSDLPHLLTYAIMILGQGLLAYAEIRGFKKSDFAAVRKEV